MSFRLACQTITFGPDQKEKFPEVFAAVARAGFEGVELGYRHVSEIPPTRLQAMLDAEGLALAGLHVGGNLEDLRQADSEKEMFDRILDYLIEMRSGFLMYSGLRYKDETQIVADIVRLNEFATRALQRGSKLCYHNHAWEFRDGAREITALLEQAGPDLWFCPDVGWVHKGERDVISFLEEIRDRIGYVHFKDFATIEGGTNTVELGDGCVPFEKIAAWIQSNTRDLWITAEQDKAAIPPEQAVAKNAAYLKKLFAK